MSSNDTLDLSGSQTDVSGNQTDVSGNQTDVSGSQTDVSGSQTDVSGSQTDVSGSQTDVSGSQTDVSGSQTDVSGSQTDVSGNQTHQEQSAAPLPPVVFSIDDLMSAQELIEEKEATDRATIDTFVNPPLDALKPALYEWAKAKFPSLYPLRNIQLVPPRLCSDGQERTLLRYYEYLLGKTMSESLNPLGSKVQGMVFTFSHNGTNAISLHVSRP